MRRDSSSCRARANARQNQAKSLIDRVRLPRRLSQAGRAAPARRHRRRAQARPFRLLVAPDLQQRRACCCAPDSTSPSRPGEDDIEGVGHNDESALFHAGKVVCRRHPARSRLRGALTTLRRRHQEALEDLRTRLVAHSRPSCLASFAGSTSWSANAPETLDDYAVAQRLLAEHWREVEAAHAERRQSSRLIKALLREGAPETPLDAACPTHRAAPEQPPDELVPGCAGRDTARRLRSRLSSGGIRHPGGRLGNFCGRLGHPAAGTHDPRRPGRDAPPEARTAPEPPPDAGLALLSGLVQQNKALVRDIAARPSAPGALGEVAAPGRRDPRPRRPARRSLATVCATRRVPCTSAWIPPPAAR